MQSYLSYTLSLVALFCAIIFAHPSQAACPAVNANFTASAVNICGPGATTVNFTNTSTGANAATADYDWYLNGVLFDNTTGLVAPNGSNIAAVGTYTYMLVATDASVPCSDTAVVVVTIHPVPNANFTFNPNNACAGTNVVFTNTSTGTTAGTTYAWNFGDGGTATTTNANHTYAAGGTFNVTLTVTNAPGCTNNVVIPVTALPIPIVNIAGDDGDGNTNNCLLPADPTTQQTVNFTNTTTGAVSYAWNFGDGGTSTLQNPSHLYTSYGTYTVTMTATGANGCTATGTLTVVFEKYVSAAMTLNITEYSGCAPHTLSSLQNLSVNGNTYTWNFGDGSPAVVTTSPVPPTHTYTTNGTFTISLTASNSCNTANSTISPIVIVTGPNSNFTSSLAGAGNLGCASQNITFTNLSTNVQPANNYQWFMGNGNTYTNVVNPPMQTYPTQGTYTVMMVAGNACGNDTTIINYQIDSLPVADITVNPLDGCSPLQVTVTNNSYGPPINYAWFVDGVFSGNAANIGPLTFTAPPGNAVQNHTISLTVSNHCGTDNDAEIITVHPAVVALFTPNTDSICAGQNITFTSQSQGDNLTYDWDFGNGNTAVTAGPHTINYPVAGTYNVRLIVNGYCGDDTLIFPVTVNPIPVADIVSSTLTGCSPLTVNFTNNSTAGGTYAWTFAGGVPATSNLYNPGNVTFTAAGPHNVNLTVTVLGCTSTDAVVITVNPLPVNTFTVVPNNGCSPLGVTITNTSPVTAGDTYAWDLGNGVTSTTYSPSAQMYTTTGIDSIYTVSLTITTALGCSTLVTSNVTVHPLPTAIFTALPDTVCATTPVAFLNNSIGASTYQWSFGDGGTSTLNSPSHSYTTQGTYTVQLIAITAFNCRDTITADVYVDSIPAAAFTQTTECVGFATQFTDLSTGGPVSWNWNLGDGNFSTVQNPVHLYAAPGTYNVLLTVTNPAGCSNATAQLITVNPVPVANFNSANFCFGQTTQFTDITSGTPTQWNWDFGDGGTSTLQNPGHVYAATGTYTVTLIAFAGTGCSDTISQNITITGIPTADFNFVQDCILDTTFFTSTSLGAPDTFVWNFGDGTIDNANNPNPVHVYNTANTYNVTLTAGYAASGCTNSITYAVLAYPRTNPSFTSNAPCLNASTNFADITTGTPVTWNWDLGDGTTSATQNPSHTYTIAGTFSVQLITSNGFGCIDSITQNVTVNPLPVAGFSFTTVCLNSPTLFTDLSTGASQWNYDFGDGFTSTTSSPSHTYTTAGTFTVIQIVTNVFGCTDTVIQNVVVNPNPVAQFNVSTSCHTYPTQFTDASTGAVQWSWNFGDGSPVDLTQNPSHIYPVDGTYVTNLLVTNIFGCTHSTTQNVVVLPQPQAAFTNNTVCGGQAVVFTDNSTGTPTTWTWDFDDGTPVDNNQNPVHTFALGGTYNVMFIAGNPAGCADTIFVPVSVYTVPVPNFTADTVCLFSITSFTDLSTDAVAITNWYWDFGDGNNSFQQNPTYIYQNPGVYNVTLVITNINGCDSSITLPVTVNDIPVAAFNANTVCMGSPTVFTDVSTGFPTSWIWDFGDGTVITGGPVELHTYANAGSYIVQLIVSGGSGICTDQVFGIVTVSADAVAGSTLPDSVCSNSVFNFTDASTITTGTITGHVWDMGDGTQYTTANGTHTYAVAATYFVTHTVTSSGGCTSTDIDTVVVSPLPTTAFGFTNACQFSPVQFTDMSTAAPGTIISWAWDFGDGNTSSVQNPQHIYTTNGIFNVILTVTTNAGCVNSDTVAITIHEKPQANFSYTQVCWGIPVEFIDITAVNAPSTVSSWSWNFGDGGTSTLPDPDYPFTVYNDTFMVQLIVTTNFGCSDTVVQAVPTLPIVNFDFGPDVANGCAPLSVVFGDSSTIANSNIVGWVWNFGDNIFSFNQNPTHVYPQAGQYYPSLQVVTSDGCIFNDTLNFPITVYPQPVAGFYATPNITSIAEPQIQVTDAALGAVGYYYDFGDNEYSNQSNPLHYYTIPGTYDIMQIVTNQYGCHDTATYQVVIEEISTFYAPNAFTVDDDGLNDVFYTYGTGIVEFKLLIFDRWGELMFETDDITVGWDGTYKGVKVKPDVYVWHVKIRDLNEVSYEKTGHVTVLRDDE